MSEPPSLGFIGAGKAGSTLARVWSDAGYAIRAIYSRTGSTALALAEELHTIAVDSLARVASVSDLIVLAVPDYVIQSVAVELANIPIQWEHKAVIHLSGAHSQESLIALATQGAMTGSLHPAFPFSGDTGKPQLLHIVFALETSHELLQAWLKGLISAAGGEALMLPQGSKSLYHAALVIASNYTVTLYAIAEQLLTELGASQIIVDQLLNALVGATVHNLHRQGIPAALTGPLVRNDTGTIQGHLDALWQTDPALAILYRHLARLSYPLLEARDISTHQIEFILQQDEKHRAPNDS